MVLLNFFVINGRKEKKIFLIYDVDRISYIKIYSKNKAYFYFLLDIIYNFLFSVFFPQLDNKNCAQEIIAAIISTIIFISFSLFTFPKL